MSEELHQFLKGLRLEKYLSAFEESEVELDDIPLLTDAELQELGLPLGPRKRLLNAAKALGPEEPGAETGEAGRRQLTVLFCDIVGSTQLSQQLDPEDLREVNQSFVEFSRAAIHRYDGYIANYLGDGILAFFGYPTAHEDEAARAILASFELMRQLAEFNKRIDARLEVQLEIRIGIATGPVVVGDVIGEGTAVQLGVIGETPNLAARLQDAAEPGSIVVSETTYALEPNRFVYESLGERPMKGFTEPVKLWRVISEVESTSSFEAKHRTGLLKLVGREPETHVLEDAWEKSCHGHGQVVLLSGEAGIGKSRIVYFANRLVERGEHHRLRYQCSPYHSTSPLYPIQRHIEVAARLAESDTTSEKLDKLDALLDKRGDVLVETRALIATMVNVDNDGRHPELHLNPQELKRQTLNAIVEVIRIASLSKPVLVILEDVHWIDPTTLELLNQLIEDVKELKVMLLVTFRLEFQAPWTELDYCSNLVLGRLSPDQTRRVVLNVTQGKALPEEVLNEIVHKTDGVPLYVEELTKSVLESGVLIEETDRYVLNGNLGALAIPSSLQDSLMARLDRLAPIREITQTCAAIGREFSVALLQEASGLSDEEIDAALRQLEDAELVFEKDSVGTRGYLFKHALVRDAAYESMLRDRRRSIHAEIAIALQREGARLGASPELIAQHYSLAGMHEEAVPQWQAAADESLKRSAYLEALKQLDHGLEQVAHLKPSVERDKRELTLLVKKMAPLLPTKGYASQELERTSSRAMELGRQVGDPETVFPTLYSRWVAKYVMGVQDEGLSLSREYLERAKLENDIPALMVGHRIHAVANLMQGKLETAKQLFDVGLTYYKPEEHAALAVRFGQDFKVQLINYLGVTEALLGRPDYATEIGGNVLEYARGLDHVNSLAYALWHVGVWLPAILRDGERVRRFGRELLELVGEHHIPFWEAFGGPHYWLYAEAESPTAAARKTESVIDWYRRDFHGRLIVPELLVRIAELYVLDGLFDEAADRLRTAEEMIQVTTESYWEAELHRVRAELCIARNGGDGHLDALEHFERALAVAEKQNARLLQLRAATGKAKALASLGRRAEGAALLQPVYGVFTEGFHCLDLQEASALLEALGEEGRLN